MGYRGRLLFKFIATIERLDTAATAVNNPAGYTDGYDHRFRTPIKLTAGGNTIIYSNPIRLNCQVETEAQADPWDVQRMLKTGDNRDTSIKLVFHYQQLEDEALVDAKGRAKLYKGDKLIAIHTQDGEELDDYSELGLVCTAIPPHGYGLSGGKRNLLVAEYGRRDQSTSET